MIQPARGTILISDPFLKDPDFIRTIILLCEHNEHGSIGFIINRPYQHTLEELLPELKDCQIPVYNGGPVQKDSLHFIHAMPDRIADSQKLTDDIYWGGNFEQVLAMIRNNTLDTSLIRFFLGYSGWENGQLQSEMETKSWLTIQATRKLAFQTSSKTAWKEAVRMLGKEYEEIINYPIDPQLN